MGGLAEEWTMDSTTTFGLAVFGMLAVVALVLVMKTLYTVRTATAGVVERFGKFNRGCIRWCRLRRAFILWIYR